MKKIGVLITNTGTPDAPTIASVRRYLKEFLSDKRIVQVPRLIWLPLLYGFILPLRPFRSAKLYQKIWTQQGSPLRINMQKMQLILQNMLANHFEIEIGMNYGNPSISQALENLQKKNIDQLIVLPLYPQFSNTTSASSLNRVKNNINVLHKTMNIYEISDYADDPDYIYALADSVEKNWKQQGKSQHLLISFHGIPENYVANGDPYHSRCAKTANLLAEKLQLAKNQWTLCFQSRFGYSKWLKPATQFLFETLPKQGIKEVDVICPGFAVDCLETLEEIALRGQEIFLHAGGKKLNYIPALNDNRAHIQLLAKLIQSSI